MSFIANQLRELIETALLNCDPNLNAPAAVELLLGTCAVESDFGTWLRQRGGGPALGVFQMERATFEWLQGYYGPRYGIVELLPFEALLYDLRFAAIMARLRYRIVPEPLPPVGELYAQAVYWKQHYNTPQGRGDIQDYIRKYERFVR